MAGEAKVISRLFVLWRTPDETRRRFVVGELWREHGVFYFAYAADLAGAEALGFRKLAEFPDHRLLDHPYYAKGYLFPTFAQRIPSPRRPDFSSLMEQWQVDHPDDHFEVLSRSGGILATDGIELAEHRAEDDSLSEPLRLRVAGTRFFDGQKLATPGSAVTLRPEPANKQDPDAVQVVLSDNTVLGYIPRCYSRLLSAAISRGDRITATLLTPVALPHDRRRWQLQVGNTTVARP